MAQPQLLFAAPIGQSSVRVIFDQPMRMLGKAADEDPENSANWTTGGGLPAITEVLRISNVEFELILASPAPVAAGYTVTVALTVENATSGETIDPAFDTATFAVTAADVDLTITSAVWTTDLVIDLVFSEPISPITFTNYTDVVQFLALDPDSREPAVIGFTQSGATATITLENPGTAGARYSLLLNRELFVSVANTTILKFGEQDQLMWGQGAPPVILSMTALEDQLDVTSSEVLGDFPAPGGWVLSHALYDTDVGTLGPQTPLEEGTTAADMVAPGASFDLGATVTFDIRKTPRTVQAGTSWTAQASNFLGAGTETVGVGTTTLSKTAGAPFEVVFSGGTDSLSRAGRQLTAQMAITFTPGLTEFPLIVFTMLNTQASVVIEKTTNDLAVIKIFRGENDLGTQSREFDPTVPFDFTIIDATSDTEGFLAVEIDGEVLIGAPSSDILDNLLIQNNVGATAIAVTLGSPAAPTELFDVLFSQDLLFQTYFGQGFLGIDSRDLFSFPLSTATDVVGAAAQPPLSTGYQGTGCPAFGVHAEHKPGLEGMPLNAIQVVMALNDDAPASQFTGTVTLLTGTEQVLDQVLIDECYLLGDSNEIVVVFMNPVCWAGTLINVGLTIDGTSYDVTVPVTELGAPEVLGFLAPQPSKWYHQRLAQNVGGTGIADFGPASTILTP